jgi:hypothetical protein
MGQRVGRKGPAMERYMAAKKKVAKKAAPKAAKTAKKTAKKK